VHTKTSYFSTSPTSNHNHTQIRLLNARTGYSEDGRMCVSCGQLLQDSPAAYESMTDEIHDLYKTRQFHFRHDYIWNTKLLTN